MMTFLEWRGKARHPTGFYPAWQSAAQRLHRAVQPNSALRLVESVLVWINPRGSGRPTR